ncbi:hypothetical protein HOI18_03975, partial [Candidatus Uhrbacteria bacterium]|nr:hypothetical protein [Candidatus Uhrbacteria bacterium]
MKPSVPRPLEGIAPASLMPVEKADISLTSVTTELHCRKEDVRTMQFFGWFPVFWNQVCVLEQSIDDVRVKKLATFEFREDISADGTTSLILCGNQLDLS